MMTLISLRLLSNLPVYPVGQEREVTVLQTGKSAYAWSSATTNFVKPAKENWLFDYWFVILMPIKLSRLINKSIILKFEDKCD
jgi:hypothetical protein